MTRAEYIQRAYLRATNKPTAPSAGTKKYNQLVGYGEYYTEIWQNEPGVDWASLYDYRNSGTITATDTFALDSTIQKVSKQEGDYIRILHTDNVETEYELVSADRLYEFRSGNVVAVAGRNLVFPRAFTSADPQFGGTIIVPSYGYATFPDTDAGDITVDDPNWLVVMGAAEFVRNDVTRQQNYPVLIAEANQLMRRMKEDNGYTIDEVYRPSFLNETEVFWE